MTTTNGNIGVLGKLRIIVHLTRVQIIIIVRNVLCVRSFAINCDNSKIFISAEYHHARVIKSLAFISISTLLYYVSCSRAQGIDPILPSGYSSLNHVIHKDLISIPPPPTKLYNSRIHPHFPAMILGRLLMLHI